MKIQAEKYSVDYNKETAGITFRGSLLLYGSNEYAPILQLMKDAVAEPNTAKLTLDLAQLRFLNSSGISMLTKFVIFLCDEDAENPGIELELIIKKGINWQEKLSKNLTRLMPSLQIVSQQPQD